MIVDINNIIHLYNFDPNFYKTYYTDLSKLTETNLYLHYINHGRFEGRFPNEQLKLTIFIVSLEQIIHINKSGLKNVANMSKIRFNSFYNFQITEYKKLYPMYKRYQEIQILKKFIHNDLFENKNYLLTFNKNQTTFFLLNSHQMETIHKMVSHDFTTLSSVIEFFKFPILNLHLENISFKNIVCKREEGVICIKTKDNCNCDRDRNYKPKITFITPSIGREFILYTIDSLLSQTNPNWKAIIIYDNIQPIIKINDSRIKILKTDKKEGECVRSAGNVRNYSLNYIDTDWIGFVDDDDTISTNYLQNLLSDINNHPQVDCIIFRMMDNKVILPEIESKMFYKDHVGISFAFNYSLNKDHGIKFSAGDTEDFELLDKIYKKGFKMLLSKHLNYFVGGCDVNFEEIDEIPEYKIN